MSRRRLGRQPKGVPEGEDLRRLCGTGVPLGSALGDQAQVPRAGDGLGAVGRAQLADRKSTRLNSSHLGISYAVFCLKKKKKQKKVNVICQTLETQNHRTKDLH